MEFIGIVIFILVASAVVLGALGVGAYLLLGVFLKRTPKNVTAELSPEEKARRIVAGYRDPIRFFGEAGLSRAIRERAGNRCEHQERGKRCNETDDLQLDHIYPWFHGGWTILSNAQVLCTRHNQDKGAAIPSKSELVIIQSRRSRTFPYGAGNTHESFAVRWKPSDEEKAHRMEWLKTNEPFVHVPGSFNGR